MISLAEHDSKLLKEWDYEKNKIDPKNVSYGTGEKAWWICPKGHSYQAYVYNKRNGYGKCKECNKLNDFCSYISFYISLLGKLY